MTTVREDPRGGLGARFAGLIFAIFVGGALVAVGLPQKAKSLAAAWDQPWLSDVTRQLASWVTELPEFSRLLEWIVLALGGYAGALVLLALRHRKPGLFGWGFAAFTLSAISLHVLAWLGLVAYHIARFG